MHVISGRFSVLMNFEFFLSYLRTDHAKNYLFCIMICHCLCNFLMYSTKVRRKWKIRCQNFDRLYGWFAEGERACCPITIIYSLIFFVHCFYFLHAHWSINIHSIVSTINSILAMATRVDWAAFYYICPMPHHLQHKHKSMHSCFPPSSIALATHSHLEIGVWLYRFFFFSSLNLSTFSVQPLWTGI